MAQFTAGEVLPIQYINEASYGVTPAGALSYGGDVISLSPSVDLDKQFVVAGGNRSFTSYTIGCRKAKLTLKYYNRPATDWRNLIALYGFGSTSGLADHEGSFSALLGVKQASNYYYNLYYGCKITKATISCEKPGMPIVYQADIIAQWVQPSTTKTFTGLQSVTVGADAAVPAAGMDSWLGIMQVNIAAGGLVNFFPRSWSLELDNKMKGQEGNVVGADAAKYGLEAGIGINEAQRDITFKFTMPSTNETWTNAKLLDQAVTALTIPIGTRTITLSGGVFKSDDCTPDRKQDLNDETTSIMFNAMSIA